MDSTPRKPTVVVESLTKLLSSAGNENSGLSFICLHQILFGRFNKKLIVEISQQKFHKNFSLDKK